MGKLKDVIGAAIGGALLLGFLSFVASDFVAKLPWPLSKTYMNFAIGAVIGCLFACIALSRESNRKAGIELFAQRHGNKFRDTISKREATASMKDAMIFTHWNEAKHVVEGEFQGLTFKMFDLTRELRNRSANDGPRSTYQKQSVIIVDSLPEISGSYKLQRKPWFRKVVETVIPAMKGDQIITLAVADRFTQTAIDAFAEKYVVMRGDELPALDVMALQAMTASRGWSVERSGTHAIFYMQRTLLRATDLATAMNEIKTLLGKLNSSNDAGTIRLIPREDTATFSVFGLLKIFAGAAIGMFGSFAVFIPIFFMYGDDYPFLVFLWPIIGLACSTAGVFTATRIGGK